MPSKYKPPKHEFLTPEEFVKKGFVHLEIPSPGRPLGPIAYHNPSDPDHQRVVFYHDGKAVASMLQYYTEPDMGGKRVLSLSVHEDAEGNFEYEHGNEKISLGQNTTRVLELPEGRLPMLYKWIPKKPKE